MVPVLRRREHRGGEVQCCVAQGGQGNGAAAILLGQGRPRILRRLKLLPGVNLETLQISAQQNVVQLQGVAGVAAPEGAHGLWVSLGGGEFSEQFTLPTEVDAEKATADYAHGILTIMLPKAEHTRARKIAISTSQNQQPLIESQAT